MNATTIIAADHAEARSMEKLYPSWAERFAHFKGTPYQRACLLTIAQEASADGIHQDNELATCCYDAAECGDPEDVAHFISEVERIFAEYRAVDEEDDRLARWQSRNPRKVA